MQARAPVLLVLGILPWFFVGGPDWASSSLYRSAWNLGHILFFGLLTLAIQLRFGPGNNWRWLTLSLGVFFTGLGIEYLQGFWGRQVGWGDILRNMVGCWLVLAWWPRPCPAPLQKALVWGARLLVSGLLVMQLATVGQVALQEFRIIRQLPLLMDLEAPGALNYWSGHVDISREHSISGAPSLAIELVPARFSGVGLNRLAADWRAYDQLRFSLYNPEPDTLPLTLRINDRQHDRGDNAYDDRFNTRVLARPGWSHHSIDLTRVENAPATRSMDMTQIRRLGFFASNLESRQMLFLDGLRLDRDDPE